MLEPNHRSTKFSDIETRIDHKLDRQKYEYDREKIRAANEARRQNRPFSNYTAFEEPQGSKDYRLKSDNRVSQFYSETNDSRP